MLFKVAFLTGVWICSFTLLAQARKTSLLPDNQLAAIVGEASGDLDLDTIIGLGRFNRVPATSGFNDAANYMLARAKEYGLDAHMESFPADGKTTYNTFTSYLSWQVSSATLSELTPKPEVIGDYSKNPIVLADYSNSADVTTNLVDVGAGTAAKDYTDKEVRGKLVLASGSTDQVQRMAVEHGAVGILSYFGNQDKVWTAEHPNLVRWGHLPAYTSDNKFAFMLSQDQAREYRTRLAGGEKIEFHAQVSTTRTPGSYNIVTAVIPGSDPAAGEIVYSCHMDHQKPAANDNASGCATILEDGRILAKLIREGKLPQPRRTIRLIFPTEIVGTTVFLSRHPEIVPRMKAVVHMDMVGGDPRITHSVLHITRTPASISSFVNDVGEVFGEYVIDGSMRMILDDDASDSILSRTGGKDALWADFTPFDLGSDHQVYESSYHIPALYLRDSPDIYIHTDGDRPANMDSTKLRRVAVIGAASAYFMAALGEEEAKPLAAEVFARGGKRQSEALRLALAEPDAHEAANLVAEAARQERETLASIAQFAPNQKPLLDRLTEQVDARATQANLVLAAYGKNAPPLTESAHGKMTPQRNPEIVGLLSVGSGVYSPAARGGKETPMVPGPTGRAGDAGIITYDAVNLVDGHRTIAQIRDILSAAYGTVSEEYVYQYFKQLQEQKVLSGLQ
jgi:aminopeptidase YwaD